MTGFSHDRPGNGNRPSREAHVGGCAGRLPIRLVKPKEVAPRKTNLPPVRGTFYATPWIGVGYLFGTTPIEADEKSFNLTPVSFFPAVHVGYGFD